MTFNIIKTSKYPLQISKEYEIQQKLFSMLNGDYPETLKNNIKIIKSVKSQKALEKILQNPETETILSFHLEEIKSIETSIIEIIGNKSYFLDILKNQKLIEKINNLANKENGLDLIKYIKDNLYFLALLEDEDNKNYMDSLLDIMKDNTGKEIIKHLGNNTIIIKFIANEKELEKAKQILKEKGEEELIKTYNKEY